jgi:type I restriction enzyme, S subunit
LEGSRTWGPNRNQTRLRLLWVCHISKTEGKCVLVTPGNFEIGGGYKEGSTKYFHGEYPQEYVRGDLVVTMTDLSKTADTLGYSAKVPREQGKTYLHNQRVGKVYSKSSETELDYILLGDAPQGLPQLGSEYGDGVNGQTHIASCTHP